LKVIVSPFLIVMELLLNWVDPSVTSLLFPPVLPVLLPPPQAARSESANANKATRANFFTKLNLSIQS
jgi:hypothetical protein